MWVQSMGQEDLLEEKMATPSSRLAWRIPQMEEPGEQLSMGNMTETLSLSSSLKNTYVTTLFTLQT